MSRTALRTVLWNPLPSVPVRVGFFQSRLSQEDLKGMLGDELRVQPTAIELGRDDRGKPRIERPRTSLRFSLSRSSGATAVALSPFAEVGVDVEFLGRDVTGWRMWSDVLTPAELDHVPPAATEQNAHLLRTWVAKEAILKAAGVGLAIEPRELELGSEDEIRALPGVLGRPDDWSLASFCVGRFVGAVAVLDPAALIPR